MVGDATEILKDIHTKFVTISFWPEIVCVDGNATVFFDQDDAEDYLSLFLMHWYRAIIIISASRASLVSIIPGQHDFMPEVVFEWFRR